MIRLLLVACSLPLFVGLCVSQDPPTKPAPIAATRWTMKEALEADEKAKGRSSAGQGGMRKLLDPEIRANWPRDWLDENMPLTKAMRNELLWVTSRVNNCLY
jgi:hypothetical protein